MLEITIFAHCISSLSHFHLQIFILQATFWLVYGAPKLTQIGHKCPLWLKPFLSPLLANIGILIKHCLEESFGLKPSKIVYNMTHILVLIPSLMLTTQPNLFLPPEKAEFMWVGDQPKAQKIKRESSHVRLNVELIRLGYFVDQIKNLENVFS